MRSQWNGSDDLTCFKGLVGGCRANSRRACCVGVLPSEQTGSVCDGACSEFWLQRASKCWTARLWRSSRRVLLACVLAVCPPQLGWELSEGGRAVRLVHFALPSVHAVPGASWVCGEYELLERKGSKQDCSRVTSGKFLIIFSIGSCIPE